jgi:MFS family permease
MTSASAEYAVETVPLHRNRDYMILWSGQLVSAVGSGVSGLALTLVVLALTHSPARAGLVGFASTLPAFLLTLPAGVLVDRWDRKRIMLVTDALRAVVLGGVAVALALHALTYPEILLAAFLCGGAGMFFGLSQISALPAVVPTEQLHHAIAASTTLAFGAGVTSQPLAGFLYSLGRFVPFAVDAVSYVLSFASLLFVRPAFQEEREASVVSIRSDIGEGGRWFWRMRIWRITALLGFPLTCCFSGLGLVLVVRAQESGARPTQIGVMLALVTAGGLLGSLAAPWVTKAVRPLWIIVGAVWIEAGATLALFFVASPLLLGALAGLTVTVFPISNVVIVSRLIPLIPERLRGRTISFQALLSTFATSIGVLTIGFLAQEVGPRTTLLIIGAVFASVAIAMSLTPEIRHLARLEPRQADAQLT